MEEAEKEQNSSDDEHESHDPLQGMTFICLTIQAHDIAIICLYSVYNYVMCKYVCTVHTCTLYIYSYSTAQRQHRTCSPLLCLSLECWIL